MTNFFYSNNILAIEIRKQFHLFSVFAKHHVPQVNPFIQEQEVVNPLTREKEKLINLTKCSNNFITEKFINGKLSKYTIMKIIGHKLQLENGGKRWKIGEFTTKYLDIIGNINPWTTKPFCEKHDKHASIRSLIYEMSPSSAQHWFKYGKRQKENRCKWSFLNLELMFKNANNNWEKSSGGSNGKWYFKIQITEADCVGLLPTISQLNYAQIGRKIGKRQNSK